MKDKFLTVFAVTLVCVIFAAVFIAPLILMFMLNLAVSVIIVLYFIWVVAVIVLTPRLLPESAITPDGIKVSKESYLGDKEDWDAVVAETNSQIVDCGDYVLIAKVEK